MAYTNSRKYGSTIQHYKKKSGDISLYITYKDKNNKLKRIKVGDKSKGITESYCFQKRNEILTKIRLGEDIPIKSSKRKSFIFEKAFEHYLEWAKENKKTWKHNDYQVYHKHLAPILANKPLGNITLDISLLRENRAKERAVYIISLVQDTSSLEKQGLEDSELNILLNETKEKFLNGEYKKNL